MSTHRRSYTEAEKHSAVEDVRRFGVCETARRHGIPKGCVGRWAAKAGVEREEKAANKPPLKRPKMTGVSMAVTAPTTLPGLPSGRVSGEAAAATKKKTARRYTPSEKAVAIEYAHAHGVAATSREFGMSRFALYDWLRRSAAAATGEGPAPTSGPAPDAIEAQRDAEIVAMWRQHQGLGPSQIRNQLRRSGVRVSVNTVRRVMEDAGYRPPKVKRQRHDKTYEASRPNQMWHLDYVQRYINRQSTFSLILIDDYSRFVVGYGVVDAERADMVLETFENAVQRYGRPEIVMNDRGSAFWSWRGISRFTKLLTELGIDQYEAEQKEWNGKIECFNGNLHKELFDVHRFYDVGEMHRRLGAHLHWYNHSRTHHALGGLLVPADRYYGRAEEVLARIEAGAGRELGDVLELRDRNLDLFRVTSHNGVPEVWLLGQKLLGHSGMSS